MTVNWSVGGTMDHPAYAGRVETCIRSSKWEMNSTSWTTIPDMSGGNITLMNSTSVILVFCHLSVEADGAGGHGIARLQKSVNDGTHSSVTQFNVMGSTDNQVGDGFHFRVDHNDAAGTTYKFRVQYKKGNTSGNHAIADTGPGESTRASLFYYEMQE
tara:strand:+ start:393 stop:866 length:474 start_codon:yes stop_codon:yes gene_type:complete